MAQGAEWVPHLLTFQETELQRNDPPETTPIFTPDQKAYKWYWHKRTPRYARAGIHVQLVRHLSIPGRLSVYEVAGTDGNSTSSTPTSPLATPRNPSSKPGHVAPTIIIGNMNAAPTPADRGGQATPQDQAVRATIEMLGLVDLTANLEGQPSHFPHQIEAAPSHINVCYGDPTTIIRAEA